MRQIGSKDVHNRIDFNPRFLNRFYHQQGRVVPSPPKSPDPETKTSKSNRQKAPKVHSIRTSSKMKKRVPKKRVPDESHYSIQKNMLKLILLSHSSLSRTPTHPPTPTSASHIDSILAAHPTTQVVLSKDWKKIAESVDGVRAACKDYVFGYVSTKCLLFFPFRSGMVTDEFRTKILGFTSSNSNSSKKSGAGEWRDYLVDQDRWQVKNTLLDLLFCHLKVSLSQLWGVNSFI